MMRIKTKMIFNRISEKFNDDLYKLISLLVLTSFLFYFWLTPSTQWIDIYVFAVVLLICQGFLYSKVRQEKNIKEMGNGRYILLLSLIYFIPRLLKVEEQVIWLDEYIQYLKLLRIPKNDFLINIFHDAQPPLDYLFTNVSVSLFGENVWALKLPSLIWGWVSVIICFHLGRALKVSKSYCLLGCLFFISHPIVFGYSLEGRPYSFTIMTGALLLLYHELYIQKPSTRGLRLVFSTSLLHLFSLGFQPMFFVATVTVYMFAKVKNKVNYMLANLSAFFVASPFFYIFYTHDKEAHIHLEKTSLSIGRLESEILSRIFKYVKASPMWTITFIMSLILALYLKRKNKKEIINIFSVLFLPAFYLLTVILIFAKFINAPFFARYILIVTCFIPYVFFSFFNGLNIRKSFLYGVTFFLICLNLSLISRSLGEIDRIFYRTDWKKIYKNLNQDFLSNDHFLAVNFHNPFEYDLYFTINKEIYGSSLVNQRTIQHAFWTPSTRKVIFLDQNIDYCQPFGGNYYIMYNDDFNHSTILLSKFIGSTQEMYLREDKVTILKLPGTNTHYYTMKLYYEEVLRILGKIPVTHAFVESLMYLEFIYGDDESYEKHYKTLLDIAKKYDKPSYLRRVLAFNDFFKNNQSLRKRCN